MAAAVDTQATCPGLLSLLPPPNWPISGPRGWQSPRPLTPPVRASVLQEEPSEQRMTRRGRMGEPRWVQGRRCRAGPRGRSLPPGTAFRPLGPSHQHPASPLSPHPRAPPPAPSPHVPAPPSAAPSPGREWALHKLKQRALRPAPGGAGGSRERTIALDAAPSLLHSQPRRAGRGGTGRGWQRPLSPAPGALRTRPQTLATGEFPLVSGSAGSRPRTPGPMAAARSLPSPRRTGRASPRSREELSTQGQEGACRPDSIRSPFPALGPPRLPTPSTHPWRVPVLPGAQPPARQVLQVALWLRHSLRE